MPKQRSPVEQTTFAQGLVTEANPLTFPPNASIDEDNFVIERRGTRRRRLGMNYEVGYTKVNSGVVPPAASKVVFYGYNWENAGGSPDTTIGVIQTGPVLKFFDTMSAPVSPTELYSYDTGGASDVFFSFTVVDGLLVVATGNKEVLTFTYSGGVITPSTVILKVRDLFGVDDFDGSVDLTQGIGLLTRPSSLSQEHRYNLRNQSFNIPRSRKGDVITEETCGIDHTTGLLVCTSSTLPYSKPSDTIQMFSAAHTVYPCNSDDVGYSLYPNVEAANKTVERFHAADAISNTLGAFQTAKGHFIIDALERGTSRLEEYAKLLAEYPTLTYPLVSLLQDKTPKGASVVAEFAGRVWFGGFSGEVLGGDSHSPALSSYLFFSQLVSNPSDLGKCYQEADPTSREMSDLVDTDGGFLRISGAYGIIGFKNLQDNLIVIAKNGVWRVFGGDTGFTATNYMVSKVTDRGCDSPHSIIEIEGGVAYWGDDGIYILAMNELGDYASTNVSQNTIQSLFEDISSLDKLYCNGSYDSYERKARWLFQNNLLNDVPVKELIYDLNLGAFYPATLPSISGGRPKPVAYLKTPPYQLGVVTDTVVSSSAQVVVGVDDVTVAGVDLEDGVRELVYLVLTEDSGTGSLQYTFAVYRDENFIDWLSFDTVGVDAAGYLLTGYLTGGDSQRKKSVSYLTTHFVRTEEGFEDDGSGALVPIHPSSCKIQTQWEWSNSANSNRWGREFQAYRYNRLYLPSGLGDVYDTGHSLITTKNKLRGSGRALSLLFKTEPRKDCKILGWAMIVGVDGNV